MSHDAAQDDATGRLPLIAGKYRVLRVLGRGGMGVVYEAENTWTGRRVAVKVLADERRDAEQVARFLQEARTTATLRHPAVVDVLDMGRDPDTQDLYLVQELLVGETLRARLDRDGALAPEEAVRVVRAVLEGLAAAHAAGVVHRDVKPSNVMLTEGGSRPRLIDFGIAKAAAGDASAVETSTGQILGTPAYMAPEQLRGERSVDAQADVWSAGAVLYECLSGRAPFRADNYNLLVYAVLSGEARPLRDAAPDVPPGLAAVVDRALSADRARRYASAAAMLDALDAPWDRAPDPPPAPPRRRPWALVVTSALVASAGLALALRPHPTTRPSAPEAPRPAVVAPDASAAVVAVVAPDVPSPQDASVASGPRVVRHHPRPAAPAVSASAPAPAPAPAPDAGRAALLTPATAYPSGAP
ncbi:MAG: serine/threonine-protein kinase [Polyangiales bacterium]